MEIISKISKGTKMDQIYIPKNRQGFNTGSYVIIKPIETQKKLEKPYFYNIQQIEPIKLEIINEIFSIINSISPENIIITGSFIESGFNFNDMDILIITNDKIKEKNIEKQIEDKIKIETHVITMDETLLREGLSTDPIWRMMISTCISKKRLIPFPKIRLNYKLLDIQLLKSKSLLDNFDYLNGNEKYKSIRNMVAILLFIKNKKINKRIVNEKIEELFKIGIEELKQNMLDKKSFIKKYKKIYNEIFNKIMKGIENATKQEKIN